MTDSGDKPLHYKIICISVYTDDLKKMDEQVAALKAKGITSASRSALIRHALSRVDLESFSHHRRGDKGDA